VISYTNLFRNKETIFLLSLPVPRETIFRWKLMESTLLASWAFLFLIAPLLLAYGRTNQAPWHFYIVTVVLVALFIILPAVFGAFAAVTFARFLHRRTFQAALVLCGLAAILLGRWWLKPEPLTDEMLETRVIEVLDRMLSKTRFAQFPLLPSHWLSASVLNYAEGAVRTSLFFALVLLSNALFFGWFAIYAMGSAFYEASSALHSRGDALAKRLFGKSKPREHGTALLPSILERVLRVFFFVRADRRALVLKDIRMFWRDTTQWGQSLVLFGLLAVYIINLRHFSHQLNNSFWIDLVSYLNLGACSLNLATLTTRFVYPQFSLEGKRVWIVGMAPLGMVRIVITKYIMSTIASLAITLLLVVGSCYMLQMPWERTIYFSYAVAIMALTLNGLAIGLGVLYPNFKEDNPGKIVSGFGGTFCLVLSFLYILVSVVALGFGAPWARAGTQPLPVLLSAWSIFAVLSVCLGWVPLKLGIRRVREIEL
jgi:ABC-2 type transport system permease protein